MLPLLLSMAAMAGSAATGDTGAPASTTPTDPLADVDQDGDGYTPNQGDCDDTSVKVAPGKPEVCGDHLDNDCNGLYDDRCDDSVHLASLRGGGGCTGGGGIAGTGTRTAVLLPLLWLVRARRNRG